jgi:hypothetical protein
MNLILPALLLAAAVGLAVTALLLVRKRAPEGGYFNDSDRAAGIFGVLATGFAFVLGFVVFLAFSSYDSSRVGAETEALKVAQLFEAAQFLAPESSAELGGEVICYGRYVARTEWPAMQDGTLGQAPNPWGVEMFRTLLAVEPEGPVQETAYSKWTDLTSDREEARRDRVHGADGIIPVTLWIVLLLGAAVLFVYMLFFADSGERAVVQGLQIGTVVLLLGATLLLIRHLNDPFQDGAGGLKPTAMERTLYLLEVELADEGNRAPLPCSESGEQQ